MLKTLKLRKALAAFCVALGTASAASTLFAAESRTVESPTKVVKVDVKIDDFASYKLTFDGAKVLGESRLGIGFGASRLIGESSRNVDETWTCAVGKRSVYVDRCVETTFELQEVAEAKRKWNVVLRAYDDGVAIRYVVPKQDGLDELTLDVDETEFAFGANLDCWATYYPKYNTSQEEFFLRKKLSDVKPDSFVGMPLVVKGEGFIAALTEADLLDWAGAQFASSPQTPTTIKLRLTPRDDKRGAVVCRPEVKSPWRVVLLGKKPVDLINNSGIVENVATPCNFDASWVEPGNSAWDWWAPKNGREISNAKIKEFIDFAASMGWEYFTLDAGWERKPGEWSDDLSQVFRDGVDVPACVEYGKSKGVRLFLWYHVDPLKKAGVRKTLERCAKWGVAGLKIDFMDSHSQETVQWLTETCRIAAENRLLVNYHGMYKPTGMTRTFPNQITREGVRGNEYNRWSALTSEHLATLPFTRCMLGPADFTPGGFLNEHPETFKKVDALPDGSTCHTVGTRARELALCMIYDSPLRTLCDLPSVYAGKPGLEFLRELPTVWDDTTALDGEIGEFVAVARRSGEVFYLSALTNDKARSLDVRLDFLEDDAEYEATIYADASETDSDANAISITTQTFKKGDLATLKMARDGGWNAIFRKVAK